MFVEADPRYPYPREGAVAEMVVGVEVPATGVATTELAPISTGRPLVEITERVEDLPVRAKDLEGSFVRVTVLFDAMLDVPASTGRVVL